MQTTHFRQAAMCQKTSLVKEAIVSFDPFFALTGGYSGYN
jgi:hypothetical protein